MSFFTEDRRGQTWSDYENWLVVHLHRVQNWNLSVIASTMRRTEMSIKCQLEKLYGVHKDSIVFSDRSVALSHKLVDEIHARYESDRANKAINDAIIYGKGIYNVDYVMWFDEAASVDDKISCLKLSKHQHAAETKKHLPNLYIRIGECIKGLTSNDFVILAVETLPDEHWFLVEDYVKCVEKLAGNMPAIERKRQTYLRDCYRQSIRKILASDKGYEPKVLEWLVLHKFI